MATIINAKDVTPSSNTLVPTMSGENKIPTDVIKELNDFAKSVQGIIQTFQSFIPKQPEPTQLNGIKTPPGGNIPASKEELTRKEVIYKVPDIDKEKLRQILETIIVDKLANVPPFVKDMKIGDVTGENFNNLAIKIPLLGTLDKKQALDMLVAIVEGQLKNIFKE